MKRLLLLFSAALLAACSAEVQTSPPGGAGAGGAAKKGAAANEAGKAAKGGAQGAKKNGGAKKGGGQGAKGNDEMVQLMRSSIEDLMAREEKDVDEVTVQHILVSFQGRGTKATRSREEAENLAAMLFARVQAGADMNSLVTRYSDDPPSGENPGTYVLVTSGGDRRTKFARADMVAAFGDVGWRLEVGEFGVAPHNPQKSKFGWHIIKRVN